MNNKSFIYRLDEDNNFKFLIKYNQCLEIQKLYFIIFNYLIIISRSPVVGDVFKSCCLFIVFGICSVVGFVLSNF